MLGHRPGIRLAQRPVLTAFCAQRATKGPTVMLEQEWDRVTRSSDTNESGQYTVACLGCVHTSRASAGQVGQDQAVDSAGSDQFDPNKKQTK